MENIDYLGDGGILKILSNWFTSPSYSSISNVSRYFLSFLTFLFSLFLSFSYVFGAKIRFNPSDWTTKLFLGEQCTCKILLVDKSWLETVWRYFEIADLHLVVSELSLEIVTLGALLLIEDAFYFKILLSAFFLEIALL